MALPVPEIGISSRFDCFDHSSCKQWNWKSDRALTSDNRATVGGVRTHRWISCIFQCWSAPVGIVSVVGYFWVLSVSLFFFWRRREVCRSIVVGYSWYRCQTWTSRMDNVHLSTWSRSRLTALHLHLGKWHDQISEFCHRSQFECHCYSCSNVRFDIWQSFNEPNRECHNNELSWTSMGTKKGLRSTI